MICNNDIFIFLVITDDKYSNIVTSLIWFDYSGFVSSFAWYHLDRLVYKYNDPAPELFRYKILMRYKKEQTFTVDSISSFALTLFT